ncbi:MAG: lysophospholipid acyltransferase family protein [Sinimarinibacterium sp.]|jgi:1-acyl-sn-glycerol-3-phosphate acyltransferase
MLKRLFDWLYAPVAGTVFFVSSVVVCTIVIVGPTLAIRRELGRIGVRLMLASIGVPLTVKGREHLPEGACVIVANHASYVDGLVLTAALPRRFNFVVQDGAASWPMIGLTLRRMGVIFVNRESAHSGAQLTRQLMRRLHHGESLAIFAEGTFKQDPGLLPFKTGAFLMAARTGTHVVPAGIRGTRYLYGGGRKLPRWSPVQVEIQSPIAADGKDRDAALRLRDLTRERVLALCREPDLHLPQAIADAEG